ncbi:HET-domain-containing protein, partial [Hyaloscypha hepaticicola]
LLRGALRECEKRHSKKCDANTHFPTSQLPTDILLIDVAENQLVKTSTSCQKYLALSYVWGSVPMFKTMQENLASLQVSGALLHLRSQRPRIVRDAMDLTRYLGHRYLWCDALCIVQNDAQSKHSEIAKMSVIYGEAFLTICALSSSNAGVGLLGFSETLPRDMPQDISGSTKTSAYVSIPPSLVEISYLLPYEQRAWTFQERLLSKRCLLFTATHIYFHC